MQINKKLEVDDRWFEDCVEFCFSVTTSDYYSSGLEDRYVFLDRESVTKLRDHLNVLLEMGLTTD